MTPLARYRRNAGISQRALARAVGVHHSVISRLERGQIRPGIRLAARIEAATGGAVTAVSFAGVQKQGGSSSAV
jgi:transcriptional regulator with XRE-family HTH domain